MLITDRNFNTSFYDPALRHSSHVLIILFISTSCNIFYRMTVEGLSSGALANEPGFLGLVNSQLLRSFSLVIEVWLTKVKIHFKTGSTYEIILSDIRIREPIAGSNLSSYSFTRPEQNRPYFYSCVLLYNTPSKNMMHSGNLVKSVLVTLESFRLTLNTFLLTLFASSLQMLESLDFNGGKIIKQANGVGNASHTVTRSLNGNLIYLGNHKSKLFHLSPTRDLRFKRVGKTLTGLQGPGLNLILSDIANQSKGSCTNTQVRYNSTDTNTYGNLSLASKQKPINN
jgi:hypothetical protein